MERFKVAILCLLALFIVWMGTDFQDYNAYADAEPTILTKNDKLLKPVVLIERFTFQFGEMKHSGVATGFAVHNDGEFTYILTNNHVCVEGSELNFSTSDEEITDAEYDEESKLELVAIEKKDDLCLLKTTRKLPTVTFFPSEKLNMMDELFTIGAPEGVYPMWVDARFSGYIDREVLPLLEGSEGADPILLSAIIVGGQSGSPVYNKSGKVIGIVFATASTTYGGFAIPSEDIISFLDLHL